MIDTINRNLPYTIDKERDLVIPMRLGVANPVRLRILKTLSVCADYFPTAYRRSNGSRTETRTHPTESIPDTPCESSRVDLIHYTGWFSGCQPSGRSDELELE